MRHETLTARVWAIRSLNPYHRLTLLMLAHLADATGVARTTPRQIAHRIGADTRTIQNAMRALADDEYIEWVDVRGGRGRDNTYRLTV